MYFLHGDVLSGNLKRRVILYMFIQACLYASLCICDKAAKYTINLVWQGNHMEKGYFGVLEELMLSSYLEENIALFHNNTTLFLRQ